MTTRHSPHCAFALCLGLASATAAGQTASSRRAVAPPAQAGTAVPNTSVSAVVFTVHGHTIHRTLTCLGSRSESLVHFLAVLTQTAGPADQCIPAAFAPRTADIIFAPEFARGRIGVSGDNRQANSDSSQEDFLLFDRQDEIRVQPSTHTFTAPTRIVVPEMAPGLSPDSEATLDSAAGVSIDSVVATIAQDTLGPGDSIAGHPTMAYSLAAKSVCAYHTSGLGLDSTSFYYTIVRTVSYWIARSDSTLLELRDAMAADPARMLTSPWTADDSTDHELSAREQSLLAGGVVMRRIVVADTNIGIGYSPELDGGMHVGSYGARRVDSVEVLQARRTRVDPATLMLPPAFVIERGSGEPDPSIEQRLGKWLALVKKPGGSQQ